MPLYARDTQDGPFPALSPLTLMEAPYASPPMSPVGEKSLSSGQLRRDLEPITTSLQSSPDFLSPTGSMSAAVHTPSILSDAQSGSYYEAKGSSMSSINGLVLDGVDPTHRALPPSPLPKSPSPMHRKSTTGFPFLSTGPKRQSGSNTSTSGFLYENGTATPSSASEYWGMENDKFQVTPLRADWDDYSWDSNDSIPTTPIPERAFSQLPPLRSLELIDDKQARLGVVSSAEDIPAQVHKGTTHLSVQSCPLSSYEFLYTPSMLVVLDLSKSGLTELPSSITHCAMLEELNISSNPLGQSPKMAPLVSLRSLQRLRVLLVDNCALPSVPQEIMTLTYLQILGLRGNALTYLPSWLYTLEYLDCLLLEGNESFTPSWCLVVTPLLGTERMASLQHTSTSGSNYIPSPSDSKKSISFLQKLRTQSRVSPMADKTSRWFARSRESSGDLSTPKRTNSTSGSIRGVIVPSHVPTQTSIVPQASILGTPTHGDDIKPLACFLPVGGTQESMNTLNWFASQGTSYVRQLKQYFKDLDALNPARHQDAFLSAPWTNSGATASTGLSTSSLLMISNTTENTPNVTPGEVPMRGGILEEAGESVLSSRASYSADQEVREDASKRFKILCEVIETEQTYVTGLNELMDIYVRRARHSTDPSGDDRVLPLSMERRIFGHVEGIVQFHRDAFLPSLLEATKPLWSMHTTDPTLYAKQTAQVAVDVGNVFSQHAAYFKMYMNYVNQYDSSVQAISRWSEPTLTRTRQALRTPSASFRNIGQRLLNSDTSQSDDRIEDSSHLSNSDLRKFQHYLRKCREDPRHSQINLEGYLLLPIQRIPRYRLLLEQLVRCTGHDMLPDTDQEALARALAHISLVASWVNEGKRQSEQGRRLLQWQSKLRGTFSAPLVQPHRRLICDGPLRLRRVSKRVGQSMETVNDEDVLEQTSLDMPIQLILCNDLAVIVSSPQAEDLTPSRRSSLNATDPDLVDVTAVFKPQAHTSPPGTVKDALLPPASLVGQLHLRVVDSRHVFYFTASSHREAARWRAVINAQPF